MPAPSLLIICLPSQTKVAPRPAPHPVRSSCWGTPSRHRKREQWLVLDSAWTQHPIQLCCLDCSGSACLSGCYCLCC